MYGRKAHWTCISTNVPTELKIQNFDFFLTFAICGQFWRRTPLTSEPLSQDKGYLEVQRETCFDVPDFEDADSGCHAPRHHFNLSLKTPFSI